MNILNIGFDNVDGGLGAECVYMAAAALHHRRGVIHGDNLASFGVNIASHR